MSDDKKNISEVEISDEMLDKVTGGGIGGNPQREGIAPKPVETQTVTIPQRTTFPVMPQLGTRPGSTGSQAPEGSGKTSV